MEVDEIRTPRLLLKQLHTNDVGSQDLEWFHQIWSYELATQWSSRGPCKSIGDSQNAASLRVLSKLGFEELGRFEQEGRLPLAVHGQTSPVVGVYLRMKK
ncbi:hypothetical protein VTK56DRAFT_5769 [Thermocarpiscus australiensis]